MMGFFSTTKGYVNPRVLVSPDVLPFRPTRGIYVTISEVPNPTSPESETLYQWYDQVRIPDMVNSRGVAGAWTFSSETTTLDQSSLSPTGISKFESSAAAERGRVRIHVYFLDDDPLECAAALKVGESEWAAAGRRRVPSDVESILFEGPLKTIIPWKWDWFEENDASS
jgi:hypothetical protein